MFDDGSFQFRHVKHEIIMINSEEKMYETLDPNFEYGDDNNDNNSNYD